MVIWGQKPGHWVKLKKRLVNSLEATFFPMFVQIWVNNNYGSNDIPKMFENGYLLMKNNATIFMAVFATFIA